MPQLNTTFRTLLLFALLLSSAAGYAQPSPSPAKLEMKDFVIYATGVRNANNPQSVFVGNGAIVKQGGYIGAKESMTIGNTTDISSTLYTATSISIGSGNKIFTNVLAGNIAQNVDYAVSAGEGNSFGLTGNNNGVISANGNVYIDETSSVIGPVRMTPGYSYSGPDAPTETVNSLNLPSFPTLPVPTEIPAAVNPPTLNINSTQAIEPGNYGDLFVNSPSNTSHTTLTFNTPGTYIFNSITNTSSGTNMVHFNFNFGRAGGAFRILVRGNTDLGHIIAQFNGVVPESNDPRIGDIYLETQGTGLPNSPGVAFQIEGTGQLGPETTDSRWFGTVYAPNGSIVLGDRTTGSGALWSGHSVTIGAGQFDFMPMATNDLPITPVYPAPAGGKVAPEYNLIGSELYSLHTNATAILALPNNDIFRLNRATGKVLIEVVAKTKNDAALLSYLNGQGFELVSSAPDKLTLTGWFPISNLLNLNTRDDLINHAYPMFEPINNVGRVTSQGDVTMRSDAVRDRFGATGSGVKVGVLSDSYNNRLGADLDLAEGDLPGSPGAVVVAREFAGSRTDEGRAMMQIVHDVAPGAHLVFRTGIISPLDFSHGIRQLATEYNCKVIVDDITYITEPFLKDGLLAKTVKEVVTDNKVTYVTSAGNFGKRSYDAAFSEATGVPLPAGIVTGGVAHNFGGGNISQRLQLKEGTYTIVMQWDDDFYSLEENAGARLDMDLFLVAPGTGALLYGFNRNNLGGNPVEVMPFVVSADTEADLVVVKAPGSAAGVASRFKYIIFRGDAAIAGYSGASTVVGHANAEEAISVAAMLYANVNNIVPDYPSVASFSSRGGTQIAGESTPRLKPDITAPNGVNTTVNFGSPNIEGPPDVFPNFFGTSASAPHVAGVAALLIEAKGRFYPALPAITPAEVKDLMKSTAQDIHTPLFDYESGSGAVLADEAMLTMANARPILSSLEPPAGLTPSSTNFQITVRGKYLNSNTKVYVRGAEVSTTIVNSEEATAMINGSVSDDPAIQLYNPPRTPSRLDGGLSEPLFLFSQVKQVVIKAVDQTKKYGQPVPALTATVTINDVAATPAQLQELKLDGDKIKLTTLANALSDVAIYSITPSRRTPLDPVADANLINRYQYTFVKGTLSVEKLPVKIKPLNQTIVSNGYPNGVTYAYNFGSFNPVQQVIDEAKASHKKYLVNNALAVISGFATASPALSSADLANMGTVASFQSIRNARTFLQQNNGPLQPVTSDLSEDQFAQQRFLVDLAAQSVNHYKTNAASAPLVAAPPQGNLRGLLSARSVANGTAEASLPNGQIRAMVNGEMVATINGGSAPLMNGQIRAMVNGQIRAMVNGELMAIVDGELVGVSTVEVLENGQIRAMVNGSQVFLSNGELVTMINGQIRAMVNGELMAVVNGQLTFAVVENGVFKVLVDGLLQPLVNGQIRAMVNGELMGVDVIEVLANGQIRAMVNGEEMFLMNGQIRAMVNGQIRAMVNNDFDLSTTNNSNAAIIIDGDDVGLQDGAIGGMFAVNMITGMEAGMQKLVPGALFHRNFEVSYDLGNVSVLPAGSARKLIVKRECVRKLSSKEIKESGNKYQYAATFSYTNHNAVPFYVFRGTHNRIVIDPGGSVESDKLPEVFEPGTRTVQEIRFSGHPMYWEVTSLDSVHKTAITSANNVTANCSTKSATTTRTEMTALEEMLVDATGVYPNPATDKLMVNTGDRTVSEKNIMAFDATGRSYLIVAARKINATTVEVNVQALRPGAYVLKLKVADGYKTVRFIKL